jgi:hypothetical protein
MTDKKEMSNLTMAWLLAYVGSLLGFGIWFLYKLLMSILYWLKYGKIKFVMYQPACEALGFNCYPNTGWVVINQVLEFIYAFEVAIFLFIASGLINSAIMHFTQKND